MYSYSNRIRDLIQQKEFLHEEIENVVQICVSFAALEYCFIEIA